MTANESWVNQGRQSHGYFGHGSSPADGSDATAGTNELFRLANAAQRVDYAATSIILHAPRNARNRWEPAVSDSARDRLKTAVAAWYGASALSRDAFRTRFLDPYTGDETVDRLRSAARDMVEGQSYDDLAHAGEDFAAAAQQVGVDRWPRFIGDASHRAVEAVSRGDVPGVVKASASDAPIGVAGLTFLGLLAIIFGVLRPSTPVPSKTYSASPGSSLPIIVEAVPVPLPKEGETPTDVLKPNGQYVGTRGENSGVRELPGGEDKARELFDRLTAGKGGTDITPSGHPGQVIETSAGTFGLRPKIGLKPPGIDMNVPGLGIRKLKYPGGAAE